MKKDKIKNKSTAAKNTCPNKAAFRFVWAGRDESFICLEHSGMLCAVAHACSYDLRLIPVAPEQDVTCHQIV